MDEISLDLPVVPGVELLQRVPLFHRLGYEETMSLAAISHVEERADGEHIIQQDSLGNALYILKEGCASVRRRDQVTGELQELGKLGRGELFGEMSLIDDQLTSAEIIATSAVEMLVIPRRAFEALLAGNERLAVKVYGCFCRALSDKLRKANQKLGEAEARAAKARF